MDRFNWINNPDNLAKHMVLNKQYNILQLITFVFSANWAVCQHLFSFIKIHFFHFIIYCRKGDGKEKTSAHKSRTLVLKTYYFISLNMSLKGFVCPVFNKKICLTPSFYVKNVFVSTEQLLLVQLKMYLLSKVDWWKDVLYHVFISVWPLSRSI